MTDEDYRTTLLFQIFCSAYADDVGLCRISRRTRTDLFRSASLTLQILEKVKGVLVDAAVARNSEEVADVGVVTKR
jgi:hypothetical protein